MCPKMLTTAPQKCRWSWAVGFSKISAWNSTIAELQYLYEQHCGDLPLRACKIRLQANKKTGCLCCSPFCRKYISWFRCLLFLYCISSCDLFWFECSSIVLVCCIHWWSVIWGYNRLRIAVSPKYPSAALHGIHAGLLARRSPQIFSLPGVHNSSDIVENPLAAYSGGTAPDFHRFPFSPPGRSVKHTCFKAHESLSYWFLTVL